MPAPTSYTDATLAQFIVDDLGAVGVALGLVVASAQVVGAVYGVQRVVGVAVAEQTDMPKLEAIARWLGWRAALAAAVGSVDLKAGSAAITMSQRFEHLKLMAANAEDAAAIYPEVQAALAGSGGVAVLASLSGVSDPYGWRCTGSW